MMKIFLVTSLILKSLISFLSMSSVIEAGRLPGSGENWYGAYDNYMMKIEKPKRPPPPHPKPAPPPRDTALRVSEKWYGSYTVRVEGSEDPSRRPTPSPPPHPKPAPQPRYIASSDNSDPFPSKYSYII